jgi:CheY-like chemotaxis protein
VNQKLGARLISKMKYAVETAGNGQIAVEMITRNRERYGLVLMDCQVGP